jgi:hypothetical protein
MPVLWLCYGGKQTACCVRCAGDHYSSSSNRAAVHDPDLAQHSDQVLHAPHSQHITSFCGGIAAR